MAVATYDVTANAAVNNIWRKVQGDLQTALQFECEEWEMLDDLREFDIDWSAREITVPLDINEGSGVATIPEGGDEARPSSPNAEEITLSWQHFNKRFTISKIARWIDEKNREAQIERQIVFQGMHSVRDLKRHFSDYFYGFSTGVLALVDDAGGSLTSDGDHVVPLKDGYGVAGIDDAAFLAGKFKVGDFVALVDGSSLVTNAIGEVTAVDATVPDIDVTWNGSADPDDGDKIVKANSLENTTITGTDFNRGLVGVLDGMTSVSVHSLSSSAAANWDVALADTASGRFSGIKLHKAKQEIGNEGGGKGNMVIWSQGVERDVLDQERAALRFDNPFALEIDGSPKSKGVKFHATRRVPPGYVFVMDKRSFRRMTLLPKPGQPAWEDAYKLENKSGFVFNVDYPCALIHLNRRNYAYFSNQSES
jgi:hypothetical protein